MAPRFFLFYQKKDVEVASIEYSGAWINVRDCTILSCCAANINKPPDESYIKFIIFLEQYNSTFVYSLFTGVNCLPVRNVSNNMLNNRLVKVI